MRLEARCRTIRRRVSISLAHASIFLCMILTELQIRELAIAQIRHLETGAGVPDARGSYVLLSACHGNEAAVTKLRDLGLTCEGQYPEWKLVSLKHQIQDAVLRARRTNYWENRLSGKKIN